MLLLGAASHSDYVKTVELALAEVNGLSFIKSGDVVYLKVNTNSGDPYPYSTNPLLVEYLTKSAKDLGASDVYVGDRSFFGDTNTLGNLKRNGIYDAAVKSGAKVVVFENTTSEWVKFEESQVPNWVGGFRLPKLVLDADHVINLPVVKTHFIATFTMGMKNMIGLVHPIDRARAGNLRYHPIPKLYKQIAEINQKINPSLTILDGFQALIRGGPTPYDGAGGLIGNPGIVIASKDRIAADVFGLALLKIEADKKEALHRFGCWDNPQIKAAVEAKLGIDNLKPSDISAPTVSQLDAIQKVILG